MVVVMVDLHGRKHAVGEPLQMPAGFEEVRLGYVWGVHKLVISLFMADPRIVLHQTPDDATLGVEHGQTRADLFGE